MSPNKVDTFLSWLAWFDANVRKQPRKENND